MSPKVKQVRSEILGRFIKRKIKSERTKTPLRFSRRLRHLPPEIFEFLDKKGFRVKEEKIDGRHVLSQESSIQFITSNHKGTRQRKLRYPQHAKHSKEVISILSAPRICKKKIISDRTMIQIPVQVKIREESCTRKAKVLSNYHGNSLRCRYTTTGFRIPVKNEQPPGTERILQNRKKYVLEVLNKGDMKDIEKLPSVGSKTAERIILYRQLKGSINKISELAKMPRFPKRRFHNFVAQNFLKVD